ncbi:MAG TPA: hypothetical protein VGR19_08535 [Allosphingosinicella sp.]|nr:hypothetical protein [Allosphingosinicella sp.]
MRISPNTTRSAGRAGAMRLMRAPAPRRSSYVLFWIVLLNAGLATGFVLTESVRLLVG